MGDIPVKDAWATLFGAVDEAESTATASDQVRAQFRAQTSGRAHCALTEVSPFAPEAGATTYYELFKLPKR